MEEMCLQPSASVATADIHTGSAVFSLPIDSLLIDLRSSGKEERRMTTNGHNHLTLLGVQSSTLGSTVAVGRSSVVFRVAYLGGAFAAPAAVARSVTPRQLSSHYKQPLPLLTLVSVLPRSSKSLNRTPMGLDRIAAGGVIATQGGLKRFDGRFHIPEFLKQTCTTGRIYRNWPLPAPAVDAHFDGIVGRS